MGVFETKNVGRTTMMVRDTIVSTCNDLDPVYNKTPNEAFWNMLKLEIEKKSLYYVVVNEACIPVSKKSFNNIDLMKFKVTLKTIECYERAKFIIFRFKAGMIMRKLPNVPVWVTPYDEKYWTRRLFGTENDNFSCITSYLVDLNPFFNHTTFTKDILAFNAMKNALLETDPKYAFYFMDSVSAYFSSPTIDHKVVIEPMDDNVSKHFALMMPQPIVTYMSFKGCTQEDCIVKRQDFRSFYICRFYTLSQSVEKFEPKSIKWNKIQKQLSQPPSEYSKRKNADPRLGFNLKNEYLVKYAFTFGLKTVEQGTAHLIQTLNVPLILYIPPQKEVVNSPDGLFPTDKMNSFIRITLKQNTAYRVSAETKYILFSTQKTILVWMLF